MNDPWIQYAEQVIHSNTGDHVSVVAKRKQLIKFGRTSNADSGVRTTVATFQDAVVNEDFAIGNTVDSIISTNDNDGMVIVVEGHTINTTTGELTFVSQEATLNGQTAVTLGTPLARANRMYVKTGTYASPAIVPAGNVAVYDATAATGTTAGKPDVDTSVKVMLVAGINQTEKCATSISSTDYWIITEIYSAVTRTSPQTAKVDVEVEYREIGGVCRPLGFESNLDQASGPSLHDEMRPCFYVPKNADVRMIATSDTADTIVSGYIAGVLASIIS